MDPLDPKFQTLLVENCLDLLAALRDKTRLTAAIAVLAEDAAHGIVLASLPGMADHGYVPRVGFRFHLHCTAPGKALLALLAPSVRKRIVEKLERKRFTPRTRCEPKGLLDHLKSYPQNGFIPDIGEYVEGVNCVASCICDGDGHPLAAVWVTSLAVELPEERLAEHGKYVRTTAKDMGVRLLNVSASSTAQIHFAMERARRFIEQNFQDEAAVRSYLQSTGMSESWFRRLFREKYGIAPLSLRQQLLHERAQRLLLNTNLTIKEISFQLGYDSQNYFSRAFKKAEGISPVNFRDRAPRS
jgi:DNA-binding IclR family transcriptional regulator